MWKVYTGSNPDSTCIFGPCERGGNESESWWEATVDGARHRGCSPIHSRNTLQDLASWWDLTSLTHPAAHLHRWDHPGNGPIEVDAEYEAPSSSRHLMVLLSEQCKSSSKIFARHLLAQWVIVFPTSYFSIELPLHTSTSSWDAFQ